MRITYRITTLGCKVNQQESEKLAAQFEALGFEPAKRGEPARICVINSCAVTAVADSKTRQRIRQARSGNPDALLCVIGCLTEIARDRVLAMPEVDIAIGSMEKDQTAGLVLEALATEGQNRGETADADGSLCARQSSPGDIARRTRGFLKVQDGCDRFCAYCVIPYARGPVRSRPAADVLDEAAGLLAFGYKEVALTGINLALYGRDFAGGDGDGAYGLRALTEKLCGLEGYGEYRLRLGSLEPTVIDAREAALIASVPRVCPQFHLSLQSGAARTLKAMGRSYTPDEYADIVRALRDIDPLFSVTTDVIVGFPGETEADFLESLAFVESMNFARVHVFKYSKRPGTKAAEMAGQIPVDEKNRRSEKMIEVSAAGAARFRTMNNGQTRRTLIFGRNKNGVTRGLTDNGIDILMSANDTPNEFAEVKL